MKHTAILLAAGYSSRMGTVKALLTWQGIPLIEYQIQQLLKTSCKQIVVVLGYEAEAIQKEIKDYPVRIITNPDFALGKTSSIKIGILSSDQDSNSYLIVSVDTPIESQMIDLMLQDITRSKAKIVVPVYGGKRGHPILLDGSLRNDLLSISEEKMGLKELLRKYQSSTSELQVDQNHVLYNLNTKEDYMSVKEQFEKRR